MYICIYIYVYIYIYIYLFICLFVNLGFLYNIQIYIYMYIYHMFVHMVSCVIHIDNRHVCACTASTSGHVLIYTDMHVCSQFHTRISIYVYCTSTFLQALCRVAGLTKSKPFVMREGQDESNPR